MQTEIKLSWACGRREALGPSRQCGSDQQGSGRHTEQAPPAHSRLQQVVNPHKEPDCDAPQRAGPPENRAFLSRSFML